MIKSCVYIVFFHPRCVSPYASSACGKYRGIGNGQKDMGGLDPKITADQPMQQGGNTAVDLSIGCSYSRSIK